MKKFQNSYSIIQEEDDEVVMSGTNNTVFGMINQRPSRDKDADTLKE